MNTWQSAYVDTNGIQIHYYRTGGEGPPVVINHGAGDDGLCLSRVAEALENDYDLILPDARGHGKSASGAGDYSAEARAADLFGLIQALDLERPAVGGHSMGADTSLHFAAAYPDLVRCVFLEDPPIVLPGEMLKNGQRSVDPAEMGKLISRFLLLVKLIPEFIGRSAARKNYPDCPDNEIIPWAASKKVVSFDFIKSVPSMTMDARDQLASIQKITSPVLLFTGDGENLSIVSKAAAQEVVKINDKVQHIQLKGASHDIRRTRFDGYMPALRTFLASVF